jgi:hypothetical protein
MVGETGGSTPVPFPVAVRAHDGVAVKAARHCTRPEDKTKSPREVCRGSRKPLRCEGASGAGRARRDVGRIHQRCAPVKRRADREGRAHDERRLARPFVRVTRVTTSCVPSSGSSFNIGSTPVACTATDAVQRKASCSFAATVVPPSPWLGVTTILAFGDSLTAGEVPMVGEFSFRPRDYEPADSYPAELIPLLAQRYTDQGASGFDVFTVDRTVNKTICTPIRRVQRPQAFSSSTRDAS